MTGIFLEWRDLAAIASLVLAIDGYRRYRNEKRARRLGRLSLMRRVAAHTFDAMTRDATDLYNGIRRMEWERCTDLMNRLTIDLAAANGLWFEVLTAEEQTECRAAASEISMIQRAITVGGQQNLPPDQINEMMNESVTAYCLLAAIAGKLRFREEAEKSWLRKLVEWGRQVISRSRSS